MTLPNFSGVWELNLEKSRLKQPVRRIAVRIEHEASTIHQVVQMVSASGQEQTSSFIFSTTGSAAPISFGGNAGETSARWDGATLIVESRLTVGDRVLQFRDHWSLSPDGSVLTMAHPDDDLAGQVSVLERAASQMTPAEVSAVLRANHGKRVRVTFADGVTQSVDVSAVDDEGVVHSGPDGVEPQHYWTRFDSIRRVEVPSDESSPSEPRQE